MKMQQTGPPPFTPFSFASSLASFPGSQGKGGEEVLEMGVNTAFFIMSLQDNGPLALNLLVRSILQKYFDKVLHSGPTNCSVSA